MAPALALLRFHCALEFAVGQILDLAVDAEREIAPFLRRLDAFHVLDDVARAILDDAATAGLAGEPVLVGQFDAFLAVVVHAGEAQNVRHHIASRVIAAIAALQEHARNAELHDLGGLFRRQCRA